MKKFSWEDLPLVEKLVRTLRALSEKVSEGPGENKFTGKFLLRVIQNELDCDEGFAEIVLEKLGELGWILCERDDNGKITKASISELGKDVLRKVEPSDILNSRNTLKETDKLLSELIAGEETNRKLLFLLCLSAYLEGGKNAQSAIIIGESGSGKSHLVRTITSLFPEEDLIKFTRMSRTAPEYEFSKYETLDGKIVVLEQLEGLREAAYPFLTLLSEGYIKLAVTNAEKRKVETFEVHGRPVLLTTSIKPPEIELSTRIWILSTDSSEEQTKRIFEYKKKIELQGVDVFKILKLKNLIKVLKQAASELKVGVPFLEWIEFPLTPRARRDFDKFLVLIKLSAFLHHHHRPRMENIIFATLEDYGIALTLMRDVLSLLTFNLPKSTLIVFEALKKAYDENPYDVTAKDVERHVRKLGLSLSLRTVRHYLRLLADAGFADVSKQGRTNLYKPIEEEANLAIPPVAELRRKIDLEELRKVISKLCGKEPSNELLWQILYSPDELVKITFIEDVKAFLASDMKWYGPFKAGETAELPAEYAKLLVEKGKAIIEIESH